MAVEHKTITDPDIHEPKGIASASSGTVYVADGTGSGVWKSPEVDGQSTAPDGYIPTKDLAPNTGIVWKSPQIIERVIIDQNSTTDQAPTAVDTPLQISFGLGASAPEMTLDSTGKLTVNKNGRYRFVFNGRFGRTTGTGTAQLFFRALLNGNQIGDSISHSLNAGTFALPYRNELILDLVAGDFLTAEIYRDSSGANDGGLYQAVPSLAGWSPAPAASITVSVLEIA